jgi:hypothetical protein
VAIFYMFFYDPVDNHQFKCIRLYNRYGGPQRPGFGRK